MAAPTKVVGSEFCVPFRFGRAQAGKDGSESLPQHLGGAAMGVKPRPWALKGLSFSPAYFGLVEERIHIALNGFIADPNLGSRPAIDLPDRRSRMPCVRWARARSRLTASRLACKCHFQHNFQHKVSARKGKPNLEEDKQPNSF